MNSVILHYLSNMGDTVSYINFVFFFNKQNSAQCQFGWMSLGKLNTVRKKLAQKEQDMMDTLNQYLWNIFV